MDPRGRSSSSRAFERIEGLLALAFGFLVLGRLSIDDRDARLVESFFDRSTGEWPHSDGFVASARLHTGGPDLVLLVGLGALLSAVVGAVRPAWRHRARASLLVFLCTGLSAGTVATLEHDSATPCPWNAQRFGGAIPHVGPFQAAAEGVPPGRCWAGAHASGGFALMGLYFVFRRSHPREAWLLLGAGLRIGTLFGVAQVVRGGALPHPRRVDLHRRVADLQRARPGALSRACQRAARGSLAGERSRTARPARGDRRPDGRGGARHRELQPSICGWRRSGAGHPIHPWVA